MTFVICSSLAATLTVSPTAVYSHAHIGSDIAYNRLACVDADPDRAPLAPPCHRVDLIGQIFKFVMGMQIRLSI